MLTQRIDRIFEAKFFEFLHREVSGVKNCYDYFNCHKVYLFL